ncbi:MAG: hypothetical protein JOZ75_07495, partial [Candidatus Dormibacteraeota bacterium]|nr:hypothetical protein [Candidatus Dormibacteraeota bacterium]
MSAQRTDTASRARPSHDAARPVSATLGDEGFGDDNIGAEGFGAEGF